MDTVVVALRVALSLGVVFGLLWFIHRRLTRGGKLRAAATPITVLGKQGIGAKASVVVLDADGMRFVLGVTENNVTVLHSAEAPAAAFAEVMAATSPAPVEAPLAVASAARKAANDSDGLVVPGRVPGALGGSILSPATWRQAASAIGRLR
ncbi:FliO/MopB family protein [Conyzicola sp.]|uniref:FliO/MopB family protein n=1 Tax=Conyzicola sp. TaxID=1969404 RepID=UPI003989964F